MQKSGASFCHSPRRIDMGWASGSDIAQEVWDAAKDYLSPINKKNFARDLIAIFVAHDCDTISECDEIIKYARVTEK